MTLDFTLNGTPLSLDCPDDMLLIDLLRDRLDHLATRLACDAGACGACTVLVDGFPVSACMTFAFAVQNRQVATIEGLPKLPEALDHPHPRQMGAAVQEAFHKAGFPQCGFCASGMVLLAESWLAIGRDRQSATEWLSSNICRCSGYRRLVAALETLGKDA